MSDPVQFPSVKDIILDALRSELRRLMFYCKPAQNQRLHDIYPCGIDAMTEAGLKNAIGLAHRTIIKNRKQAQEPA